MFAVTALQANDHPGNQDNGGEAAVVQPVSRVIYRTDTIRTKPICTKQLANGVKTCI